MNLGKKLSLGAMALGLSMGALTLGAGCGSTQPAQKAGAQTACGAGSCGADKKKAEGGDKSCGADKKDAGGAASCGAKSCSK